MTTRAYTPIAAILILHSIFIGVGLTYAGYFLGVQLPAAALLYTSSLLAFSAGYFFPIPYLTHSSSYVIETNSKPSTDALLLSIAGLGIILLFYDRYFIREIDYFSEGMAGARSIINSSERSGSVFSLLGNILPFFMLIPLVNTLFEWESRRLTRWIFILIGLTLAAAMSYLMGGRTVILLILAIFVSCFVGRRTLGLKMLPETFGALKTTSLVALAFLFFAYVFQLRAEAFMNGDSTAYVQNVCIHLTTPMQSSPTHNWTCDISSPLFGGALNYLHAVLLYAFHVLWIADLVWHTNPDSSVLASGLSHLFLSKLGFVIPDHGYAGYFVPLSAALLHDLRPIGLATVSFLFGAALSFSIALLKKGNIISGRYFFTFLFSGYILSLLINPGNLIAYLLFAVCLIGALSFHATYVFLHTILSRRIHENRVR